MIPDLTALPLEPSIFRLQVAPPVIGAPPLPLIPETEGYADEWLVNWHRQRHIAPESDIACYTIMDAVVSGTGQVWVNGGLITSTEIMPTYVAQGLDIANGGNERVQAARSLPVRVIEEPCLVAIGHGIRVYGHFLIELLPRILAARRAAETTGLRYRVLLDEAAPAWLLRILDENLEIDASDIEFFAPAIERVQLRHALIPTYALQNERFHPATNEMVGKLLERLAIPSLESPVRRAFISRNKFVNPAAPARCCTNEQRLIDISVDRHGFEPIYIEEMPWPQQIALFRDAEIILGLAGSGLHNALFSAPGSRLASVGLMNLVQSQIGSLRGQHNAFLTKGIKLAGDFSVDEDAFRGFLEKLCA